MNNLRLVFSGDELSRLRALVAEVAKDLALGSATTPNSDGQGPKSALDMSWSRLVTMLDLGAEPEMRTCPKCHHVCMLKATLCDHCWTHMDPVAATDKERAAV